MKRFYKMVSVMGDVQRGFAVQLDGKGIRTPMGRDLLAPSEGMAKALAAEWSAVPQDGEIDPATMPLTQLLSTALDRVAREREAMTAPLLAYLDTDLICYRTPAPPELRRAQDKEWDIWLSWFEHQFRYMLEITEGLGALTQSPEAHKTVERHVRGLSDLKFTVLQSVTALSGSLVLGLAFVLGAATPEHVFKAATVEENYKAMLYNEDKHGMAPQQEKQHAAMKRDLEGARKFLELLKI